jgi:hypothetical protein
MSTADTAEASQQQLAARTRWWEREGDPVLSRSAQVVIERGDELPADVRAKVHAKTAEREADDG